MKPTFAQAPKAFAFFQTTMFSVFFKAIFFSYWNSLSASKDFRWLSVHTSKVKTLQLQFLHYGSRGCGVFKGGTKLYIPSTTNNSNETDTFMFLGRTGRFGQH